MRRNSFKMGEYSKDELIDILSRYGINYMNGFKMLDSSHGEEDIRHNYIIDNKYVLRVNSAKVMTEDRFNKLNLLIKRYNDFGIKAPYFISDKNGNFLTIQDDKYIYLSEYLDEKIADDVLANDTIDTKSLRSKLNDERLEMISKYAEKYKNQEIIQTKSMYSIFDLSPYDELLGIDEKQDNLNELVSCLQSLNLCNLANEIVEENQRIRKELFPIYKSLPCCVFQGDENFSNICLDSNHHICGIFDFNMSGTDVNANYLANIAFQGRYYYDEEIFSIYDSDWIYTNVVKSFYKATKLIKKYYNFTNIEEKTYYLYAKLVMISGYVNVSAFKNYLKQDKYKYKTIEVLKKILSTSL